MSISCEVSVTFNKILDADTIKKIICAAIKQGFEESNFLGWKKFDSLDAVINHIDKNNYSGFRILIHEDLGRVSSDFSIMKNDEKFTLELSWEGDYYLPVGRYASEFPHSGETPDITWYMQKILGIAPDLEVSQMRCEDDYSGNKPFRLDIGKSYVVAIIDQKDFLNDDSIISDEIFNDLMIKNISILQDNAKNFGYEVFELIRNGNNANYDSFNFKVAKDGFIYDLHLRLQKIETRCELILSVSYDDEISTDLRPLFIVLSDIAKYYPIWNVTGDSSVEINHEGAGT